MPIQLSHLQQIQRGIDFAESMLTDELELTSISKAAGMSHWHFQRAFKAFTGETLKGYIRGRRLSWALERLLQTDVRILQIALEAGFESQEAFARAFKQRFELTPSQYRQLRNPRRFLKKVQLTPSYLEHVSTSLSQEPVVEECRSLLIVGLQTRVFGVDSEKNNIAHLLPALWEAFLPQLDSIEHRIAGACYGVVRPAETDGEELLYTAGTAVSAIGSLPPELCAVQLAGGSCATFQHRGSAAALNDTVNYIYSAWLARSGRRHSYGPDVEIYGQDYEPSSPDSVIGYRIPLAP